MTKTTLLALMASSLASCGGDSGTDDYQMALQRAEAKRTEAVSLAPASPCNAVAQCASLQFVTPAGHCSSFSYRPYSLVSATADAASAAAADQRELAGRAIELAPPPVTACTTVIEAPPTLGCVASTCQAVAPAN